jgi:hypothetical protein
LVEILIKVQRDKGGGWAKANGTMFGVQHVHYACEFDMNALK